MMSSNSAATVDSERRAPSAERRAPSAERRAPSAEPRAPSPEPRALRPELRVPIPGCQAPSSEGQTASSECRAQSRGPWAVGVNVSVNVDGARDVRLTAQPYAAGGGSMGYAGIVRPVVGPEPGERSGHSRRSAELLWWFAAGRLRAKPCVECAPSRFGYRCSQNPPPLLRPQGSLVPRTGRWAGCRPTRPPVQAKAGPQGPAGGADSGCGLRAPPDGRPRLP